MTYKSLENKKIYIILNLQKSFNKYPSPETATDVKKNLPGKANVKLITGVWHVFNSIFLYDYLYRLSGKQNINTINVSYSTIYD